jgi:hypothetical protein
MVSTFASVLWMLRNVLGTPPILILSEVRRQSNATKGPLFWLLDIPLLVIHRALCDLCGKGFLCVLGVPTLRSLRLKFFFVLSRQAKRYRQIIIASC